MKSRILRKKSIGLIALALSGPLFAIAPANGAQPIKQIDQLMINASFTVYEPLTTIDERVDGGRSSMAFLKDSKNQQFVLKCNGCPEGSIHEALGAYIGSSIGIPINKVKIIAPHTPCVGRKDPSLIATLHTRVPGIVVNAIPDMNKSINIYNGLINYDALNCLSEHDELCDIVALDIFLDNFDRHNYNLFFDQKNKHFHAIDMDMIFSQAPNITFDEPSHTILDAPVYQLHNLFHEPIAKNAQRFLQHLQTERRLSTKERYALKRIQSTLTKLTVTFPPKKIYDLWMKYADDAHYVYSENKKQCIQIILLFNAHKVELFLEALDSIIR